MHRLINNIQDIKNHLPVDISFDFPAIKPFLLRAFRKPVLQQLTQAEYDQVAAALETPLPAEATAEEVQAYQVKKALIDFAAMATVHLGYLLYIPHGQVQVSDNGYFVSSNDQKKPAYRYLIAEIKQDHLNTGYEAIEDMLRLLDANRAIFTKWADSDAAKNYKRLFISSTELFENYQDINGSRLLFRALAATMIRTETLYTSRLMPADTFTKLKAFNLDGTAVDDAEKTFLTQLLDLVRGHVANRTLENAILRRSIVLTPEGAMQLNIRNEETDGSPALPNTLQILKDQYAATAAEYELQIKELLPGDAADKELVPLIENTAESGFFYL